MIHRAAAAVAVVAVILSIAACAGHPASAPSRTAHTPSPTATHQAVQPSPVVPVGCADLVPLTTLQADIAPAVTVRWDETTAPVGWQALVDRQGGLLDCAWGTDDRTDAMFDDGLTLSVLADAASAFDQFSKTSGFLTGVATTVGDRSGIHCDSGSPICAGDVLAGEYWVEFTYSAKTRGGDVQSDMVSVLSAVAKRLGSAGPARARWVPPASAFAAPRCTAELGAALTGATVQVVQPELEEGSYWFTAVAAARVDGDGCTWEIDPAVPSNVYRMTILTGGSWAYAALEQHGIGSLGGLAVTSQALAGTDGELSGCGQSCDAVVSYRGSLVLLGATIGSTAAGDDERAAVDGMTSRLVAALGGAG